MVWWRNRNLAEARTRESDNSSIVRYLAAITTYAESSTKKLTIRLSQKSHGRCAPSEFREAAAQTTRAP